MTVHGQVYNNNNNGTEDAFGSNDFGSSDAFGSSNNDAFGSSNNDAFGSSNNDGFGSSNSGFGTDDFGSSTTISNEPSDPAKVAELEGAIRQEDAALVQSEKELL